MRVVSAQDSSEPYSPFYGPEHDGSGGPTLPFEYSSAGDRVRGILWRPPPPGPAPLVLVAHPRDGSKDAPDVEALALAWTRAGAAVAAIDLPLHGARASGKLGERALRAVRRQGVGQQAAATDALDADLSRHVVQQATTDLRRALTILAERADIDATRLALAGFGLGAELGGRVPEERTDLRATVLAGLSPDTPPPPGENVSVVPLAGEEISAAAREQAWACLAPALGLAPPQ
jgi:dienelactone hydrolase